MSDPLTGSALANTHGSWTGYVRLWHIAGCRLLAHNVGWSLRSLRALPLVRSVRTATCSASCIWFDCVAFGNNACCSAEDHGSNVGVSSEVMAATFPPTLPDHGVAKTSTYPLQLAGSVAYPLPCAPSQHLKTAFHTQILKRRGARITSAHGNNLCSACEMQACAMLLAFLPPLRTSAWALRQTFFRKCHSNNTNKIQALHKTQTSHAISTELAIAPPPPHASITALRTLPSACACQE